MLEEPEKQSITMLSKLTQKPIEINMSYKDKITITKEISFGQARVN